MEDTKGHDALEKAWGTMKLHPKYYESFIKVHEHIISGEGPLNYIDRHFIAIMAASRHSCSEMVCHHYSILQEKTAHTASTDITIGTWLKSGFRLEDANQKYQKLDKVNMIMAHKPWMLNKDHIIELTQITEGESGRQRWTLSQVLQAITLLAHIHSFSSFVLGCGIMEKSHNETTTEICEDEKDCGSLSLPSSPVKSNVPYIVTENTNKSSSLDAFQVQTLVEKMETLREDSEELEVSELTRRFENIKTSQADDVVDSLTNYVNPCTWRRSHTCTPNGIGSEGSSVRSENKLHPDLFTNSLDVYQYVDFVKRENPDMYRTLRDGEFSWGEHAYSLISRFYGDKIARMIDKKFMTIDSLTYMNIGAYTSVDTR